MDTQTSSSASLGKCSVKHAPNILALKDDFFFLMMVVKIEQEVKNMDTQT